MELTATTKKGDRNTGKKLQTEKQYRCAHASNSFGNKMQMEMR